MERPYDENQLLIFCRAMANVAASDGRVTEDERIQLEDTIVGLGLSPSDPKVRALLDDEFANPGDLTQIVAGLESRDLRAALIRMLIEVSCADGDLGAEERTKLSEAGQAFGFDAALVSALIDWTLDSIRIEQREKDLMERLLG